MLYVIGLAVILVLGWWGYFLIGVPGYRRHLRELAATPSAPRPALGLTVETFSGRAFAGSLKVAAGNNRAMVGAVFVLLSFVLWFFVPIAPIFTFGAVLYVGAGLLQIWQGKHEVDGPMVNYTISDDGIGVAAGPDAASAPLLGDQIAWRRIVQVAPGPGDALVSVVYYPFRAPRPGPTGYVDYIHNRSEARRGARTLVMNARLPSAAGALFGDRLLAVAGEVAAKGALAKDDPRAMAGDLK
ncbi:MAG TPA: hypothetical protein VME40_13655 [Caulobacteraceae bacterium]|nr:hypothetical protein [Caulobacteraceae bacterium]